MFNGQLHLLLFFKINHFVQDGSEDPPGPLIQKTPIILAKPPGERVCYLIFFILLITAMAVVLELFLCF